MSLLRPCAILASVLVVAACQRRVPEPEPEKKASAAAASASAAAEPGDAPAPAAAQPKVTKLEKTDLTVGKGAEVKKGDKVKVHYTGRLLDGTKFDSSLDRGDPFSFGVGNGEVIKGWDEGLIGMKPGGKRKLVIPSDMAYGKMGSPPVIPADAPLEFEIELIEIL